MGINVLRKRVQAMCVCMLQADTQTEAGRSSGHILKRQTQLERGALKLAVENQHLTPRRAPPRRPNLAAPGRVPVPGRADVGKTQLDSHFSLL